MSPLRSVALALLLAGCLTGAAVSVAPVGPGIGLRLVMPLPPVDEPKTTRKGLRQ